MVWSAKYNSFGEALVDPSSVVVSHLRFPGQYFDGETGLHYNYYRYFNYINGRYTRLDPILKAKTNGYLYSKNNVTNNIDPFGLYCMQTVQSVCSAQEDIGTCVGVSWLVVCELVCITGGSIITGNPVVSGVACQFVCAGYLSYNYYKCLKKLNECLDNEMQKCCSDPKCKDYDGSWLDPTCYGWELKKERMRNRNKRNF